MHNFHAKVPEIVMLFYADSWYLISSACHVFHALPFLFLKAVIFRTIKLTAAKKADMVSVMKGAALCRCGRKRRAPL
jgi:hypothetical protein